KTERRKNKKSAPSFQMAKFPSFEPAIHRRSGYSPKELTNFTGLAFARWFSIRPGRWHRLLANSVSSTRL
ncbi:MAG: hypothetical protein JW808_01765, partial [Victivallales bacterium]|nr:hypothetical protein [Victivallales bacterium]